jgi:hypothetical protein
MDNTTATIPAADQSQFSGHYAAAVETKTAAADNASDPKG